MESCSANGGTDADDSIPRGGPIFVPDMVSPLTRVSTFESSVINELHNLQTDLLTDSMETFDDEISVDELKIVTEEELVAKAIDEVFKDDGSLDGSCRETAKAIDEVFKDDGSLDGSCRETSVIVARRSKRISEKSRGNEGRENCFENLDVLDERKRIDGNRKTINGANQENCDLNLEVVEKRHRINGNSCNGEYLESRDANLGVMENGRRINGKYYNGKDQENCDENVKIVKKKKKKRTYGKNRDDGDQENGDENVKIVKKKKKRTSGKNRDDGDQENGADKANVGKEKQSINGDNHNPEDGENCGEKIKTTKKRKRMKGRNPLLDDGSFEAKVEPFLKIKREQEEQKAAVTLHSFNGSLRKTNECENRAFGDTERMTSLKSIDGVRKVKTSDFHGEYVPVIYPEVVLCVEVYNNKNQSKTKTHEFLVLGCQFLSELRDKIHCRTDQVMQKAGQHDPSGYFLIEDVFCNDMRDANATDYSEPILDWLRNSKDEAVEKWECILSGQLQKQQKALLGNERSPKLPCFRAVEMEKIRFCDLSFRVGAGYMYCHQGDCKHIIVLRDMRLIHPKDVQNRRDYPIVTFQMKERLHKCSVCKIWIAEKVTVDDKWAEENPCYFCKNCYYMLHYVDGSLLYEEFSVKRLAIFLVLRIELYSAENVMLPYTVNTFVSAHKRFLLTGVKVGLESAELSGSSSSGKSPSVKKISETESRSLPSNGTPVSLDG